jgi:hypothetical protein
MAVLHSLLAVYGAFDEVATQTDDPELLAIVESLLPGTTASQQSGWYQQIQDFVRRNSPDQTGAFKSAREALQELTGGEGFETMPAALSSREVGRLLQAAASLTVLKESAPARSKPVPALQDIDIEALNTVFTLAATPRLRDSSTEARSGITPVEVPKVLDELTDVGIDGWEPLIRDAAAANQVLPDVAAIPPLRALGESVVPEVTHEIVDENGLRSVVTDNSKITSEVIEVNDYQCVLLTTEFSRTPYDIEKVAAIIDPLNWDNANKFFVEMTSTGLAADQRSEQVLEEVSTDKDVYSIKTHLKYVKELRPGNNYVINYDFADDRGPDDSNQVKVDSGYIKLMPTEDGQGVRVLTTKLVAINGLSPTAVSIFAQAMGWVSIGEMMMFGDPVATADDPIVGWSVSPDPTELNRPRNEGQRTGPARETIQPVSQILVKETTKAVAEYIQLASNETAIIADKWFKGALSVEDMINHSRALGGKLASEPFRLLNTMMKNVATRPDDPKADPSTGGDPP